MKYLKLFESSDEPSLDKIAKDIVEYGEFSYELDEMIRCGYSFAIGEDNYFEGDLTVDIVRQSLDYIKRMDRRDFSNILDWHAEMEEILNSVDAMSNDEMEDYFLDIDYKYEITKKHEYGSVLYKILIQSIPTDKVPLVNNRIWQTTMKRIPINYKLLKYDIKVDQRMGDNDDGVDILNSYSLVITIMYTSNK